MKNEDGRHRAERSTRRKRVSPASGHRDPLKGQHAVFEIGATGKFARRAVGPHDAVARDQHGEWVEAKGRPHKSEGLGAADLVGYLAVSSDLSVRNACHGFQHRALQWSEPAQVQEPPGRAYWAPLKICLNISTQGNNLAGAR